MRGPSVTAAVWTPRGESATARISSRANRRRHARVGAETVARFADANAFGGSPLDDDDDAAAAESAHGQRPTFVLKTNFLAELPVRAGFGTYGGDCYFDASWRVTHIVYKERGVETTYRPGRTQPFVHAGYSRSAFRPPSPVSARLRVHPRPIDASSPFLPRPQASRVGNT